MIRRTRYAIRFPQRAVAYYYSVSCYEITTKAPPLPPPPVTVTNIAPREEQDNCCHLLALIRIAFEMFFYEALPREAVLPYRTMHHATGDVRSPSSNLTWLFDMPDGASSQDADRC